jgi:replicative DNA helicase
MTHPELPQDLDAERAVLGSVLMNRDSLIQVVSWLQPAHFYLERHAEIYAAMCQLYERRTPPDIRTLSGALRASGTLDQAGGVVYLSDLTDSVPTSYHIEHYARIVERHAIGRMAISAGGRIAARGYDASGDADELRADVQSLLTSAIQGGARSGLTPIGTVLDRVLTRAAESDGSTGVPTGLIDYDELTGGLWPGHLVVPAGRPGHGKSSFVATIAANVARNGYRVAYFTLEMEMDEVAQRLISSATGINGMDLRRGELELRELQRIQECVGPMAEWPFALEDVRTPLSEIRAKTLRHIAEYGPLTLLVIDYIQLIPPGGRRTGNRQQEIGEITRGLKSLAKECRCTVFAPSQLSRAIETRENPIPTLSDLRESGDIENDADQVVFVVRPELFPKKDGDAPDAESGVANLYVAKHRGGRVGKVDIRFDAERTLFTNLEQFRTVEGY